MDKWFFISTYSLCILIVIKLLEKIRVETLANEMNFPILKLNFKRINFKIDNRICYIIIRSTGEDLFLNEEFP